MGIAQLSIAECRLTGENGRAYTLVTSDLNNSSNMSYAYISTSNDFVYLLPSLILRRGPNGDDWARSTLVLLPIGQLRLFLEITALQNCAAERERTITRVIIIFCTATRCRSSLDPHCAASYTWPAGRPTPSARAVV